jgi:hypothetical protein
MTDWEPKKYDSDPTANAMLNIAASIAELADATNGLLYGLKYSKAEGMSIAEALEVSIEKVSNSIDSGVGEIAEALWQSHGPATPSPGRRAEALENVPLNTP